MLLRVLCVIACVVFDLILFNAKGHCKLMLVLERLNCFAFSLESRD